MLVAATACSTCSSLKEHRAQTHPLTPPPPPHTHTHTHLWRPLPADQESGALGDVADAVEGRILTVLERQFPPGGGHVPDWIPGVRAGRRSPGTPGA